MKIVSALPLGRLGNVSFRYLAMVVFAVIYDAEIVENDTPTIIISDDSFITWMSAILGGLSLSLNKDLIYGFVGYFQHDAIYLKYKQQIIEYIRKHPNDILMTDGKTPTRQDFTYDTEYYKAISLLEHPTGIIRTYDVVVHLRLEDFINIGTVIHPRSIKQLLENIGAPCYCFVINSPNTELELMYIEYLRKYFDTIIESNDVLTDYHIMKNTKTLICSASTLSWTAAFFSETVQRVYMPNYPTKHAHETFRKPITNTIAYEYKTCSKTELTEFLKNAV